MDGKTFNRLQNYLRIYGERYPNVWKDYQLFRAGKGKDLGGWPDWCWVPLAAAYAIVSGGGPNRVPLSSSMEIGNLGALAAWRMTKGIYRFDSDLFNSLWSTPIEKEIPKDVFYSLPEWCVYIKAPGNYRCLDKPLLGWFVYLEWDVNENHPELRFVLDTGEELRPYVIHLDYTSLTDCAKATFDGSKINLKDDLKNEMANVMAKELFPLISVSLYLCSERPDLRDLHNKKDYPKNPEPSKTKNGIRFFPASNPSVWLTGYRIGSAIRLSKNEMSATKEPGTGYHASPRPHIRRAHWHLFWTGPRSGEQKPLIKWIPPIPVGSEEKIVATIWPVK